MLCVRCNKKQAMPDDRYCSLCDEVVFEAKYEHDMEQREKEEEIRRHADFEQ